MGYIICPLFYKQDVFWALISRHQVSTMKGYLECRDLRRRSTTFVMHLSEVWCVCVCVCMSSMSLSLSLWSINNVGQCAVGSSCRRGPPGWPEIWTGLRCWSAEALLQRSGESPVPHRQHRPTLGAYPWVCVCVQTSGECGQEQSRSLSFFHTLFLEIKNAEERAAQLKLVISSYLHPVIVVMRYLFAFLHQWVFFIEDKVWIIMNEWMFFFCDSTYNLSNCCLPQFIIVCVRLCSLPPVCLSTVTRIWCSLTTWLCVSAPAC